MTQNVGGIDRILRIIFGIAFLVFGIVQGGAWWILAAFGAVLLVTAAMNFCGLYTLFNWNTRKKTS